VLTKAGVSVTSQIEPDGSSGLRPANIFPFDRVPIARHIIDMNRQGVRSDDPADFARTGRRGDRVNFGNAAFLQHIAIFELRGNIDLISLLSRHVSRAPEPNGSQFWSGRVDYSVN
jgi:hypothetical protein